MGLSSFFKRNESLSTPVTDGGDEVQRLRIRSRQRLVGAAVLIAVAVIGFPLVFETQPRPIAIDIPIEIARKDQVPPLVIPPLRAPAPVAAEPPRTPLANLKPAEASASAVKPAAPSAKPADEASAPKTTAPATKPAAEASSTPPKATPPIAKPAAMQASPTVPKPSAPAPKPARSDDARARALLEGKDAKPADATAAATGTRFVVQVGAFSEEAAARDMRQKVEKLGMKTHMQKVATQAGSRIRVRVGPFASRDEADRIAARLESAGVSSAVLSL